MYKWLPSFYYYWLRAQQLSVSVIQVGAGDRGTKRSVLFNVVLSDTIKTAVKSRPAVPAHQEVRAGNTIHHEFETVCCSCEMMFMIKYLQTLDVFYPNQVFILGSDQCWASYIQNAIYCILLASNILCYNITVCVE